MVYTDMELIYVLLLKYQCPVHSLTRDQNTVEFYIVRTDTLGYPDQKFVLKPGQE